MFIKQYKNMHIYTKQLEAKAKVININFQIMLPLGEGKIDKEHTNISKDIS